jgi:hypothetical protein
MPNAIEKTVKTYIRAWGERDVAVRTKLLEECFAADGRVVTTGRQICGRAALVEEISRILADPQFLRIQVTSAIDARGTIFRVRGVAERRDGRRPESFDAGEVGGDGRISLVLTFAGPLADASERAATSAEPPRC